MKTEIVGGVEVAVIRGRVTLQGNVSVTTTANRSTEVRFSDGTRVRNLIYDGALGGLLDGQGDRTFHVAFPRSRSPVLVNVVDQHGVPHDVDQQVFASSRRTAFIKAWCCLILGPPLMLAAFGFLIFPLGFAFLWEARWFGKILNASRLLNERYLRPTASPQDPWTAEGDFLPVAA